MAIHLLHNAYVEKYRMVLLISMVWGLGIDSGGLCMNTSQISHMIMIEVDITLVDKCVILKKCLCVFSCFSFNGNHILHHRFGILLLLLLFV